MYFEHIVSSRFCDKSFYTNGRTETQVLQIIFHGMSEMKVLHDQYLFKKASVLLSYLNMFQNTVSCLYVAEFHPVLLGYT
jgi:hypothetical protein